MLSASDLPACPACGSHAVHCIHNPPGPRLYACKQCGRDQTAAWEAVQPERKPEPGPVIGVPRETKPLVVPCAIRLGICAELKS